MNPERFPFDLADRRRRARRDFAYGGPSRRVARACPHASRVRLRTCACAAQWLLRSSSGRGPRRATALLVQREQKRATRGAQRVRPPVGKLPGSPGNEALVPLVERAEGRREGDGNKRGAPPSNERSDIAAQEYRKDPIQREVRDFVERGELSWHHSTGDGRDQKHHPRPQERGQPSSNLQAGSSISMH